MWVIGGFAVTTIGLGGFFGYQVIAPAFQAWTSLRHITVLGVDHLPRKEVLSLLNLPGKIGLFSLQPEPLIRKLETHPWIAKASVTRVFPNTLAIHIQERRAVAILQSAQTAHFLDPEGYVLSPVPKSFTSSLPLLVGWNHEAVPNDGEEDRQQIQQGIRVAGFVEKIFSARPIVHVSHHGMMIVDVQNLRFRFGPSFEEQWERFQILEPSLRREINRHPKEIDLRYAGKIILRKRG